MLNRTETAMPQARCFKAMELALTAQQMAERGTVWAAMSKIYTVAIVGGGIGRSAHHRGLSAQPRQVQGRSRICDLDAERMNALADEFGIERRDRELRRPARDGRSRHHRHLHAADGALSA